jgi:hypothetical protein
MTREPCPGHQSKLAATKLPEGTACGIFASATDVCPPPAGQEIGIGRQALASAGMTSEPNRSMAAYSSAEGRPPMSM